MEAGDAGTPTAAATRRSRSAVPWNESDEANVLRLHVLLGPRWSEIAQNLTGRTAIQVKSLWYGKLRAKSFRRRSLLGLYVRNLAAMKEAAADSAAARSEAYALALQQHAATAAAISEAVGGAVDTDGTGNLGDGSDDGGGGSSYAGDGAGGGSCSTGAAEGLTASERLGAGGERRVAGEARAMGAAEWLLSPAMVPVPPARQSQPIPWQPPPPPPQQQQQQQQQHPHPQQLQAPSLPPLLKVESCNAVGFPADTQQQWRQSADGWASAGAGVESHVLPRAGGAVAASGGAGPGVPHSRQPAAVAVAAQNSPTAARAIDGAPAWGPASTQRGSGGSAAGAVAAAGCDGGAGWAADALAMLTDDADTGIGCGGDSMCGDGWSDDGGATEALVDSLLLGGAAPMSLLHASGAGLTHADRRWERGPMTAAPNVQQSACQASPQQLNQPPHQPLAFLASMYRAPDAAGGRGKQHWPAGCGMGRASEPGLGLHPTQPRFGATFADELRLPEQAPGRGHSGGVAAGLSQRRCQPLAQPLRYSADGGVGGAWGLPPVAATTGRPHLGDADRSSWHSLAGVDGRRDPRRDAAAPSARGRQLGDGCSPLCVDALAAGSLVGGTAVGSGGASPHLQSPRDGGAHYGRATPPRAAHQQECRGASPQEPGSFPAAMRSWGLRELCFPEAWMPPAGPHWRYTAPLVPTDAAGLSEAAAVGELRESPAGLQELLHCAGMPPPPESGLARQLRYLNGGNPCASKERGVPWTAALAAHVRS